MDDQPKTPGADEVLKPSIFGQFDADARKQVFQDPRDPSGNAQVCGPILPPDTSRYSSERNILVSPQDIARIVRAAAFARQALVQALEAFAGIHLEVGPMARVSPVFWDGVSARKAAADLLEIPESEITNEAVRLVGAMVVCFEKLYEATGAPGGCSKFLKAVDDHAMAMMEALEPLAKKSPEIKALMDYCCPGSGAGTSREMAESLSRPKTQAEQRRDQIEAVRSALLTALAKARARKDQR